MIDGSTFSMTGNYSAPCCDQFNYHYSLQGLASLIGDFNADGMLSAADIDMLTRVVVVGDSWFDLNGDGSLNEQDCLVLIENIMNTYIGDANLDGEHNTGDLVHIFKAGEYEDDIPGNSTWAEGDFNGDGDFSAFQSRGYELGPRWPGPGAPPNPQPRPDPTPGTPRWFGDLDLDERLTAGDIDLLSAAVPDGNNNRAGELFRQRGFDLNDDGSIDQTDRRFWLEEIKQSFCGDANLDGEFNSSGFLLLFQAGEYEDSIPANSTWAEGDWNGDFEANSSDFAFCLADGGYERGPRAALQSVPEPRSSALMMLVALGFFSRKLPRIRLH